MENFTIHTVSQIGCRSEQQDAAIVLEENNAVLCIVADGVGGSQGGAKASKAVIDSAKEAWDKFNPDEADPKDLLTLIAKQAHDIIAELATNENIKPATTYAALLLVDDTAYTAHLGDSRVYHIEQHQVAHQTKDHSVIQALLLTGEIEEHEQVSHQDKNRILRSINHVEFKEPTIETFSYTQEDQFIICSDGFWESVSWDTPILNALPTDLSLKHQLEEAAEQAIQRNGEKADNTTLITVTINQSENPAGYSTIKNEHWGCLPSIAVASALLFFVWMIYYFVQHA